MNKKPFDATHHIAIDPSQRGSAIAIARVTDRVMDADVLFVGGVENIVSFLTLHQLAAGVCAGCFMTANDCNKKRERIGMCCANCGHYSDPPAVVPCRPLVMIECPDWGGYGTREVRAAVNAWDRQLQALFPKRRVVRVEPKTWQFALHGSQKRRIHATAKENSLFYTREILHRDFGDNDDLSDALCILAYLRSWLRVPR